MIPTNLFNSRIYCLEGWLFFGVEAPSISMENKNTLFFSCLANTHIHTSGKKLQHFNIKSTEIDMAK